MAQTEEQRQALCRVAGLEMDEGPSEGHPNETPFAGALAAAFAARALGETLTALVKPGGLIVDLKGMWRSLDLGPDVKRMEI